MNVLLEYRNKRIAVEVAPSQASVEIPMAMIGTYMRDPSLNIEDAQPHQTVRFVPSGETIGTTQVWRSKGEL